MPPDDIKTNLHSGVGDYPLFTLLIIVINVINNGIFVIHNCH